MQRTHMSLRLSAVVSVLACAVLLATAATGSAATATTRSCNLSNQWSKLGPTYVETLGVKGPSCKDGTDVIRSYNACRLKHGGLTGHCRTRVLGYACTEKRTPSPDQFIAKVSCAKSRESLTFTYSENT